MSAPYNVDKDRWAQLDIFNQMGNIYSEVGRSFKTRDQGDVTGQQRATNRAIDLFDATISTLIARKSPQSREVLRAKEQFLNTINDAHASESSIQSLDRYFMQFAIAARLQQ